MWDLDNINLAFDHVVQEHVLLCGILASIDFVLYHGYSKLRYLYGSLASTFYIFILVIRNHVISFENSADFNFFPIMVFWDYIVFLRIYQY